MYLLNPVMIGGEEGERERGREEEGEARRRGGGREEERRKGSEGCGAVICMMLIA